MPGRVQDYTIHYQAPWYFARSNDFPDFQDKTDMAVVLNQAIAALAAGRPAGGNIGILPGVYTTLSPIVIGNGTSSAKSSIHGISLLGLGPGRGHAADELGPRAGATRIVAGAGFTGTELIRVDGPISDVEVGRLYLDCAGLAATGLTVHHTMNSELHDIMVSDHTGTGIVTDAYAGSISGVVSGGNNTTWRNVQVQHSVGTVVHGISVGATDRGSSSPFLDIAKSVFINCNFSRSADASASSIQLRYIDNCVFVNCQTGVLGGGTTGNALEIIPPTGTSGSTFPKNISFIQCALIGAKTVTGTWDGAGRILFWPLWYGADDPTLPVHDKFAGFTTQMQEFGPHLVRKAGDTTLSNQNVSQNDPELKLIVNASETYEFVGFLYINAANATMDFVGSWGVPSGTTMAWGLLGGTAGTGFNGGGVGAAITALRTEADAQSAGTLAGLSGLAIAGRIRVSSTAGTVNFKWAQSTLDAGNLTLEKDSWIRFTRVA